jgi:3-hydroxyisobutyrate dehydrogenase
MMLDGMSLAGHGASLHRLREQAVKRESRFGWATNVCTSSKSVLVPVHDAERGALLGTGIMGTPMARSLLKAAFRVRVWNRTPEKARVLAVDGADPAETPADAVREAAFVLTMLTDTAAVLAVMLQAAESVPNGAVWLQTSMGTDADRAARLAEDHGISFVNCRVIGTRETAKRGRLVVRASGPADALDRAQPIFDALASKTVRLEPETGRVSRLKLVATAWTVGLVESLRAQLSRGRYR